ncbi:MAG: bifunctional UDP-sugar hydrolase/5'-nucleotidase [Clostridiaceae bacterium]|nr:bifunctional metallophosphatase/5'-nucleotidase [Eubacteriales bacterium]
MRKKLMSLLLVFVLVFSLLQVAALADTTSYADFMAADLNGKIVLLHTNDVHGTVDGYGKIATLKKDIEAKGATVILIDDGDYSQGKTTVSISKGKTAVDLMNQAGYDIATIGNHEFDYGYDQMIANLEGAKYVTVVANMTYNGTAPFKPNHIIDVNGVKIGFFGLATPESATKANPANMVGVSFLAGKKMNAVAQAQIAALKAAGASLVVCLGHLGVDAGSKPNRSTDVISAVKGIDLFIDGHSHTVIDGMDNSYVKYKGPGSTMLVSTGTAFDCIGAVIYDPATGKLDARLIDIDLSKKADEIVSDSNVKKLIDNINNDINRKYGTVFASSEVLLSAARAPGVRTQETTLGNLVTDSILWGIARAGLKADCAITNGGGLRADIKVGPITKNDILTVLPFGNTLALVEVTGAQLLEALEAATADTPNAMGGFPQAAGIEFTINTGSAFKQNGTYPNTTVKRPGKIARVTIQTINGQPFDPKAAYIVASNNFTAAGGDEYYVFTQGKVVDTGITLDEVLMDYITDTATGLGGVIGQRYAKTEGRINITTEAVSVPNTGDPASAAPIAMIAAAMILLIMVKALKRREN